VTDLKTFAPAKVAELSKKFYVDLGFTVNGSNEQIAELEDRFIPVPTTDLLRGRARRKFHDEPERQGPDGSTSNAHGSPEEVSGNPV
jgi:hypothetical protein